MIEIHPGTQLDHFSIDRFVASSKTTSLYQATDLDTGATVALKVPHVNMAADAVFAERFHREEEIGLTLNHPGVMKVVPNPHRTQMYMVLEWLDGPMLRDVIAAEAPLPSERALRIAIGICGALDYVHGHGIVHRDLRPEHVVLLAGEHIKLIDFGLAGQVGAKRVTFTNISELISDGDYLAPEQITGKRGDARSDLYALGVMLYKMLSGALPYGETSSLEQFNDRLLRDPKPIRKVNPEVSPELEEILRRSLERDPAHRYASAREFAQDLANPAAVQITRRWPVSEPTVQRRPNLVLYCLLAVPVLVLLIMLVVSRHK
ncbi:MAG TPA: serine/threonine-protein kinase [Acidobacteriaceae bacterium]|jgi:serine/threonine-protein kinase